MRPALCVLTALLAASLFAEPAWAQAPSPSRPILYNVYGPYSAYGPGLTYTPSYSYVSGSTGSYARPPATSSSNTGYMPSAEPAPSYASSYASSSASFTSYPRSKLAVSPNGDQAPVANRRPSYGGGPRYVRIGVAGNAVQAIVVPATEEVGGR